MPCLALLFIYTCKIDFITCSFNFSSNSILSFIHTENLSNHGKHLCWNLTTPEILLIKRINRVEMFTYFKVYIKNKIQDELEQPDKGLSLRRFLDLVG